MFEDTIKKLDNYVDSAHLRNETKWEVQGSEQIKSSLYSSKESADDDTIKLRNQIFKDAADHGKILNLKNLKADIWTHTTKRDGAIVGYRVIVERKKFEVATMPVEQSPNLSTAISSVKNSLSSKKVTKEEMQLAQTLLQKLCENEWSREDVEKGNLLQSRFDCIDVLSDVYLGAQEGDGAYVITTFSQMGYQIPPRQTFINDDDIRFILEVLKK